MEEEWMDGGTERQRNILSVILTVREISYLIIYLLVSSVICLTNHAVT
jgi:hypothetical protein